MKEILVILILYDMYFEIVWYLLKFVKKFSVIFFRSRIKVIGKVFLF